MKTYRVELVNRACFAVPGRGNRFTVEVLENQTILEAVEQAGMRLPVGCRYGACITCAAKLIQGEVDQTQQRCLKPAHLAAGFVLLCIAYPRSDCRFEVGKECQSPLYVNPFRGK